MMDIIDNGKIRKITDDEIAKIKSYPISNINGGNNLWKYEINHINVKNCQEYFKELTKKEEL